MRPFGVDVVAGQWPDFAQGCKQGAEHVVVLMNRDSGMRGGGSVSIAQCNEATAEESVGFRIR